MLRTWWIIACLSEDYSKGELMYPAACLILSKLETEINTANAISVLLIT